jgi:hypothetical protein
VVAPPQLHLCAVDHVDKSGLRAAGNALDFQPRSLDPRYLDLSRSSTLGKGHSATIVSSLAQQARSSQGRGLLWPARHGSRQFKGFFGFRVQLVL